jgi:hypothetical protein
VQVGRPACLAFLRDVMGWLSEQFQRHVTYVSDEVTVTGRLAFDRGSFRFTTEPKAGGNTSGPTAGSITTRRLRAGCQPAWVIRMNGVQLGQGYVVGWGTLALINAGLAQSKGRSRLAWFLASLLLGPIATFIIVVIDRPSPTST